VSTLVEHAGCGCKVAEALSRERGTWEWCGVCGAQVKVAVREPAPAPRPPSADVRALLPPMPTLEPVRPPLEREIHGAPTFARQPRHPLLQLLRDCAAIARWDAHAAPRSVLAAMLSTPGDGRALTSTEIDEQLADAADAAVRRERAQQDAMARAWALRTKLDRLHRAAAEDARWLDLLRVLALAVAWDAADQRGTVPPAWPQPSLCDTAVAVAVLEWLVPRAVALSESAHGEKGTLVEKDLHEDLAKAFVDPAQWARWHPVKPTRRVLPAAPALPTLAPFPVPRTPPAEKWPAPWPPDVACPVAPFWPAAHAAAVAAWWRTAAEWSAAFDAAWAAAGADLAARQRAQEAAKAEHKDALRAWDAACAQGRTGRDRHARDLLATAMRVWFGTSEKSEGR